MFGLGAINKTCIQGLTSAVLGTILCNTSEMSETLASVSAKKETKLQLKRWRAETQIQSGLSDFNLLGPLLPIWNPGDDTCPPSTLA